jgi:hypothetical protein
MCANFLACVEVAKVGMWRTFAGKVGLGLFWTLVQVLSYVHVLQLFVSTSVSSFRHERISTIRKINMKMQMQDSIDDFEFT